MIGWWRWDEKLIILNKTKLVHRPVCLTLRKKYTTQQNRNAFAMEIFTFLSSFFLITLNSHPPDSTPFLLPRLFDGLLGGKVLHHVRNARQQHQHGRNHKVVKVFLEQIERLRGGDTGHENVQPVDKHQTGALQTGRGGVNAAHVGHSLVVVDDDLVREWEFRHVRDDALLAGLFRRGDGTSRIEQGPGHFGDGTGRETN